jgi:hypothetical protein
LLYAAEPRRLGVSGIKTCKEIKADDPSA